MRYTENDLQSLLELITYMEHDLFIAKENDQTALIEIYEKQINGLKEASILIQKQMKEAD